MYLVYLGCPTLSPRLRKSEAAFSPTLPARNAITHPPKARSRDVCFPTARVPPGMPGCPTLSPHLRKSGISTRVILSAAKDLCIWCTWGAPLFRRVCERVRLPFRRLYPLGTRSHILRRLEAVMCAFRPHQCCQACRGAPLFRRICGRVRLPFRRLYPLGTRSHILRRLEAVMCTFRPHQCRQARHRIARHGSAGNAGEADRSPP